MTVTLKDIATESGCSITTVSRVLRQQGEISEETRVRVWDAAKRLNYRPNFLARGILTGRTQTIGMVTLLSGYHTAILRGVHDRLIEDDYAALVLRNDKGLNNTYVNESESNQIHRLIDRRVDGIIMTPVEDEADESHLEEIRKHKLPLIVVDREMPNTKTHFVGSDDFLGGQMAAEYLLERGHRRLAHVAGPDFASTGRLRREGFISALQKHGISDCPVQTDPTFSSGHEQAMALLSAPERPTAIFASNDYLASGVYKACNELGLRIPGDVSVVGFGDLSFSDKIFPQLTTFDQKPYAMGYQAAEYLLSLLDPSVEEPATPHCQRIAPVLVERESVRTI